jgi:hypothetical protein
MAAVKNKLGRIACDCCGHPAMLKENEAGTLTIACDECDVSSFAKKGTAAAAKWRAKLPKDAQPGEPESVPKAPAIKVPKAPEPTPTPKKAGPFDFLGNL